MKYFKFLLKYTTLILLFFTLIYFTKYYGNYCLDIFSQFFLLPIIAGLLLVNIGILYLIDFKIKNYKLTNRIVILGISIFAINLLIGFLPESKTVKYRIKLQTDFERPELILYMNNTYQLKTRYPHGQCYNLGKYQIKNDTLILENDIEKKSQNLISSKFLINRESKTLKSLNKEFKNLIIIE